MLIRFCVAIDIVEAAESSAGLGFDFLRFVFRGVVFAGIAFPGRWRVRLLCSLTLTLSLPRFVPDLQLPLHAQGPESLRGLVNQS